MTAFSLMMKYIHNIEVKLSKDYFQSVSIGRVQNIDVGELFDLTFERLMLIVTVDRTCTES
jgi:myo-inositol-hexaphosphate 3-phosphohydrolase